MKVEIPAGLQGKDLYNYLIANKQAIVNEKKMMPKHFYCPTAPASYFTANKDGASKAATIGEIPTDATVIRVKVAANTSMFCDSQMDVLNRDAGKKSFTERKGLIPHIHDHDWKIGSEVGDVQKIYYEDVALSQLGLNQPGAAQALIFETDVRKDYNEMVFNKYKSGKIRQHSISINYVRVELAINDSDYEKESDLWNKYIDQIINRELVEEKGYFWLVSEFKLLENSAVLLGANILSGTLEVSAKDTGNPPPSGTDNQPPLQPFDVSEALKKTIFIL
jgi:hypothetical protein